MRSLSNLGIGLGIVSTLLFLALIAELYYIFCFKKRRSNPNYSTTISLKTLISLLCFPNPNSSSLNPHTAPLTQDPLHNSPKNPLSKPSSINGDEETLDVELMRLHSLSGPPRFLFTIKEETKEDLESQMSRKGSRGRSLGDLLHCDTPLLTPLASPPIFSPHKTNLLQNLEQIKPPLMTHLSSPPVFSPNNLEQNKTPLMTHHLASPQRNLSSNLEGFKKVGFNPLFESSSFSPPPKFKFLKDAEEKLQRSLLLERSSSKGTGEEEQGKYVTIVVAKNRERAQVIPLSSSPFCSKTEEK